ncbi:MAG: putative histidine kinase, atypical hybrid [Ramlibacter sp.]|nr:putative histidine kinase, atypical hybrid [Ramlibacter sp.]
MRCARTVAPNPVLPDTAMLLPDLPAENPSVLFVDDEPTSRKWFALEFGDEFKVATAGGADEALDILRARSHEFGVLVTDYRMPERDGMKLLRAVQQDYRHVIRLLATAYAEKDVAIAAVNQGKVLRILEKPLDGDSTREALREALALYRSQALERAVNEGRVAALREALGFLAHELNTPLATVRGYVGSVAARHIAPGPATPPGVAQFTEEYPGELLNALERAERRALYCQSLVSTFVQSARDAYPDAQPQSIRASSLVEALLDEFPFEGNERACVTPDVRQDFALPGRRDLLYLVLCTLAKNALLALRGQERAPRLVVEVGSAAQAPKGRRAWIRVHDNGPGIPPEVLAKLTREPVTTRAASGGSGMGLMFCQRVMQAISGSIEVHSVLGQGTSVTLFFQALGHDTR